MKWQQGTRPCLLSGRTVSQEHIKSGNGKAQLAVQGYRTFIKRKHMQLNIVNTRFSKLLTHGLDRPGCVSLLAVFRQYFNIVNKI